MNGFCLVVDDSPLYSDAICQLLQSCFPKLVLRTASNGSNALSLAQQPACTLILLDYQLPGLSGGDVMRHLRAQGERTQVRIPPVVLMSTQPDVVVFARSLGAVAFLPKPVLHDELLQTLRPLISTHHAASPTSSGRLWRIQPLELHR